jgi:FKBP-type peptidyl-prolyl cis-trans isomerase FkpA
MIRYASGILLILTILFSACESNFNLGGPVYDEAGNLAIDSAKIAQYLETAEYDSLYRIHDPTGVVIIVLEEGVGSRPTTNNTVHANYTGMLLDGTVFDTNLEAVAKEHDIYDEDREYRMSSFPLVSGSQGGPIPGFTVGFTRMRSGSKGVIIIPSPYGYQDQEMDRIPANSVLVFEVDFLGFD